LGPEARQEFTIMQDRTVRWCQLLLGLGALALLGLFARFLSSQALPHRPGVSRENFDRVETGMTMKEVYGILGTNVANTGRKALLTMSCALVEQWIGDGAFIVIHFVPDRARPNEEDLVTIEDCVVTKKEYLELPHEPLLERLRRLLPW
jgi:hypothetical protein